MNYQKIYSFDLTNGEGIRATLFVSGCTRHCKGCFNPEAWSFCSGKKFTGKEYGELCQLINNPYYDGLSILGGEPFDQEDNYVLMYLCNMVHDAGKNVWIWSGYSFEELAMDEKKRQLLELCDILIDGQFIEKEKDFSLAWRGSKNQRIIDVQKSLNKGEIYLYEK